MPEEGNSGRRDQWAHFSPVIPPLQTDSIFLEGTAGRSRRSGNDFSDGCLPGSCLGCTAGKGFDSRQRQI
ncbi:hypothetical cytosolic protein [Syntrophus aciditrophicus SB]|uniref:Hypothetical cytosolic protein n=1 Tax=Syntrophus aciditrophicus (strain SB) TaxID=56780 RepID=Q2LWS3_SYNAS|nr:hypothetical cytosolic protein [Syntrophus aciditrophicus SB]